MTLLPPQITARIVTILFPRPQIIQKRRLRPTGPLHTLPRMRIERRGSDEASILKPRELTLHFNNCPYLAVRRVLRERINNMSTMAASRRVIMANLSVLRRPICKRTAPDRIRLQPINSTISVNSSIFSTRLLGLAPIPSIHSLILNHSHRTPSTLISVKHKSHQRRQPIMSINLPEERSQIAKTASSSRATISRYRNCPFLQRLSAITHTGNQHHSQKDSIK